MDLQKTKEARPNAPGKQEEGTECPLEAYGGSSHSKKDSPKNDSLDHHEEPQHSTKKDSANTKQLCQVSGLLFLRSPTTLVILTHAECDRPHPKRPLPHRQKQ